MHSEALYVILGIIAVIGGAIQAILSGPPRSHQGTFWGGIGIIAAGVCLILMALPA
jgi:uncharacterized membrane protein HdeD (DUF308 family)